MKHPISLLLALGVSLAACGPMPGPSGGWTDAPALNSDDYIVQDVAVVGLTGAELLPEAAAVVQTRFGNSDPVEGNYTETLNSFEKSGRGAVILTQDGLADDSVRTVQHLVEFDLRPDAQVQGRVLAVATGYGTRQKCYRAADPDAWTNQPCP